MNIVSALIYRKVADRALEEGLPPSLFAHHNASLSTETAKAYVPLDFLFEVYELANQHLEPGFGLRVGADMIPEDYGTLGLSWKTAWKARDVLERSKRYAVLITNMGGTEVERYDSTTHFILNRPVHRIGQAISNEASLAVCLSILRTVTGVNITPIKVLFHHKAPENASNYKTHFNCEVNFSQKTNSISFLTEDLNIPTIKADKSINKFLLDRAEEEKKGVEKLSNQLVSDVTILIKDALPSGIPSINQISTHLGMSSRTLTRKLTDNGVTFRQLVQHAQEEIAKCLLYESSHTISEIAFLTGFSEQSAFNRAFKKWTSQSPSAFRKNN